VHDFLTVGAPAPLQEAAAAALAFGPDYFTRLAEDYRARRDVLVAALRETGFGVYEPRGAYYVMTDVSKLTDKDDVSFAMELVEGGGVATVPGSSFFLDPADGRALIRFCFAKRLETLERAAEVLRSRLGTGA
jgi:aminotransferase